MKLIYTLMMMALGTSAFAGGNIALAPGSTLPISAALDGYTVSCTAAPAGPANGISSCYCEELHDNMFALHVVTNAGEQVINAGKFRISCDRAKQDRGCPNS